MYWFNNTLVQHFHSTWKFYSVGWNVGTVWERRFHPTFLKSKKNHKFLYVSIIFSPSLWQEGMNELQIKNMLEIKCWMVNSNGKSFHPTFHPTVSNIVIKCWMYNDGLFAPALTLLAKRVPNGKIRMSTEGRNVSLQHVKYEVKNYLFC